MSWQHKRQMNKSQTSRENGFKLTSEENRQFSGADFNWALRKRNGRMVRISVKSYDNGVYFCLKVFKLESLSDDDRQSERWIRVGQLALTVDEVSAFTALTGSLDVNDLSAEGWGRRSELDRVVTNLIEGRRPSDGLSNSGAIASQEDVVVNEVEVVQGVLKERDYDFQPKTSKKRKKVVLPKKSWNNLSFRKDWKQKNQCVVTPFI